MTESSPQRTINMSGILAETLRIANSNFFLILAFILLVNTPVYMSRILIPWHELASIHGELTTRGLIWAFGVIELLFTSFTYIGVAFIAQVAIDKKTTTLKSTFSFSLSRFDDVVWTYLVTKVLIYGRLLLLIFPAIIFANTSSFSITASALRLKRGTDAISYSQSLVRGHWWKVFGYQLFFELIMLVGTAAIWKITDNAQPIDIFSFLAYLSIIGAFTNFATIWQVLFFLRVEESKEVHRVSNMAHGILST